MPKQHKITKGPRRGVVLYVAEAAGRQYNFETEAAAVEFENSAWPKPLDDGSWLTSDNYRYKAPDKQRAVARQKNLKGGKR